MSSEQPPESSRRGGRGRRRTPRETRTPREHWEDEEEQILLELYEPELTKANYIASNIKKPQRTLILHGLEARAGKKLKWEKVKNKIDTLKKKHKTWIDLMSRSGVTADPITGKITMDPEWWTEREMESEKVSALHRMPPKQWDIMQRIFRHNDVSNQYMYDPLNARRGIEEENDDLDVSDEYQSGETPRTEDYIPRRVDEDVQHPDLSFFDSPEINEENPIFEQQHNGSQTGRPTSRQTPSSTTPPEPSRRRPSRVQPSANRGRSTRRRREFEGTFTDAFQGMADARRATVSALRPDRYDPEEFKSFKVVYRILKELPIQKFGAFWWASVNALKTDAWWRNTFLDEETESDEDRIKFLEGITGYDRNGNYTGANLQNFNPFVSGSSGGSGRSSSGSSIGQSSGNVSHSPPGFAQFAPSTGMGQFYTSPGSGFNMPSTMMNAPYTPVMYPQGFNMPPPMMNAPFMQPSPMMQTPCMFNASGASQMQSTQARPVETATNTMPIPSPSHQTPSARSADLGYRFGTPSRLGTQPRHLDFTDDATRNSQS